MGRRTKEEAEKTRQQILISALDTFYEKGYSQSTLVDIAQRLGLTKGAIYWHFKNKRDLFETLAKEMDQRGDRLINEKVGSLDGLEDLRLLMESYTRLFVDDPTLRKYFIMLAFRTEWGVELSSSRSYLQKKQEEFIELLAYGLKKARERGEVRRDFDLKVAAQALCVMVDGFITNALASQGDDLLQQVSEAVDMFLRGLQT